MKNLQILSITIAGLIGEQPYGTMDDHYGFMRIQVVASITYGYLIINIIVVVANILKDELPKNVVKL